MRAPAESCAWAVSLYSISGEPGHFCPTRPSDPRAAHPLARFAFRRSLLSVWWVRHRSVRFSMSVRPARKNAMMWWTSHASARWVHPGKEQTSSVATSAAFWMKVAER